MTDASQFDIIEPDEESDQDTVTRLIRQRHAERHCPDGLDPELIEREDGDRIRCRNCRGLLLDMSDLGGR